VGACRNPFGASSHLSGALATEAEARRLGISGIRPTSPKRQFRNCLTLSGPRMDLIRMKNC
jgi:hypothetical protein